MSADARRENPLRVADPALTPGPRIAFTFDGTPFESLAGETIAAALSAAGVAALGTRRDGSARGLWCGMGVCQECVVSVDGVPGRRACMTPVAAGMHVTSQPYAPELPAARDSAISPSPVVRRPQVLIVGAGPAGLAAARAAALAGAEVTVIDERTAPGGQFYKQIGKSHDVVAAERLDAQMRAGRALIAEVERLGVKLLSNATLWGAFAVDRLAVSVDGVEHIFAPQRLIVAPGVYERGVPVPGWTLPGCMATGAAQTLLRSYRVLPGKRVLVAGNGPLNLQLAVELLDGGADVIAVVEAASAPRLRDAAALVRAAAGAPALIRDGLRYRARLRRAGVPLLHSSALVEVFGDARAEACAVARIDRAGHPIAGTARRYAVDAVCAGYGFLPSNEIPRALGCRHSVRDARGTLATVVDGDGLTSVAGVYAIGDVVALAGAHAARCQGFLTGCAVARSLGLAVPPLVAREERTARRELSRHLAFQRALWTLFAAPPLDVQLARADTLVCRCEGVTRADIERALERGACTAGAVKRRTRAGMGRCQGRYCASLVQAMVTSVAPSGATPRDELGALAPRAPVKPVRISDLT
jgi:NADPH-dependent 2,4-dienoyl-CoA reductase/sulfur reductase-like enzyme